MKWEPIESAPRDRRILIGRAGHPLVYSAWWHNRFEHWATGHSPMDYFDMPTHWMPLPEAPSHDILGPDCNTCDNRGKIDGMSQETHCEHCKWQGWRADHYVPNAKIEAIVMQRLGRTTGD